MDSVGEEVSLWQKMMQYPDSWAEGTLPLRSTMEKGKDEWGQYRPGPSINNPATEMGWRYGRQMRLWINYYFASLSDQTLLSWSEPTHSWVAETQFTGPLNLNVLWTCRLQAYVLCRVNCLWRVWDSKAIYAAQKEAYNKNAFSITIAYTSTYFLVMMLLNITCDLHVSLTV